MHNATGSHNSLPTWSRLHRRNAAGLERNLPLTKRHAYHIEVDKQLYSLWGTLHIAAPVFPTPRRGRQYLACCVIACCASCLYQLDDWNAQLLDSIVVSADAYHAISTASIKRKDYELSLENLHTVCALGVFKFRVHLEHVVFGKLYGQRINLAKALNYFFSQNQLGILQIATRALVIGFRPECAAGGAYFMYDCQAQGAPLFAPSQGASYVLRMRQLQQLLYCTVATLNVRQRNVSFYIHKVDVAPQTK